jgi:hypothetical protein
MLLERMWECLGVGIEMNLGTFVVMLDVSYGPSARYRAPQDDKLISR